MTFTKAFTSLNSICSLSNSINEYAEKQNLKITNTSLTSERTNSDVLFVALVVFETKDV